ncbi:MAG: bifunctional DNA-formamidopyrimidine glycosylase/DNA-(apurinic or apyrimidinic site) lyase [Rhodospirillales bacterium]|nr:bifunctional DNA-formamidopyrimidine glycosylase/DNA-(apurinic or apyrimidinic site) lyase [Rhodospirillales bacterium]
MPELPEVETVRCGIAPHLEGHRLAHVAVRRKDLRRPLPEGLSARLEGRTVVAVERRAKYLLIRTDDGAVLIVHLGMSGRITILGPGKAPPPGPHDHVDLVTDAGVTLRYTDPRRFGLMDLGDAGSLGDHPLLAGLGPEPLDEAFTGRVLADRLSGKNGPLKTALLDQTVVAGLGNIYVCEALYRAGLSPRRKAGTVRGARAERLAGAIRAVLDEAVAAGGSSLRDYRQASGDLGYFQFSFAVYGRAGQACPACDCDVAKTGGITRIVQSGRSTFFCAKRQR